MTGPDPLRRAAAGLLCVYLATMSGHLMSMDGLYMLHQAYALLFDGSVRFTTPLWTWREEPTWNSLYGIGLSLLYLPGLFVVAPLRGRIPVSLEPPRPREAFYLRELYEDPVYLLGASWLHAVVTAFAAYLVGRLVVALGFGRRAALWATAFYGLGSAAFVYARGDFAQPLAGLCVVAALLAAVTHRQRGDGTSLAACALAAAYAVLVRPVEGLLLAPAVAALLLPAGPPSRWRAAALRPGLVVAACALVGVAATLLVNVARHGSAFDFGYPEGNTWEVPEPSRWLAVLVSPGRGLLWEFPALLLVPLGVAAAWRSGRRREVSAMLAVVGMLFVNVTAWAAWWGGWCWGLRLFVPALPLLAVFAGAGVEALATRAPRAATPLAALLLAAGVSWALPGVFTDILAGYGAGTEGVPGGWHWSWRAYPPLGAWPLVERVFASSTTDPRAIDVVWLRLAATSGAWVLVVPAVLLGAAAWLWRSALRAAGRRGARQ